MLVFILFTVLPFDFFDVFVEQGDQRFILLKQIDVVGADAADRSGRRAGVSFDRHAAAFGAEQVEVQVAGQTAQPQLDAMVAMEMRHVGRNAAVMRRQQMIGTEQKRLAGMAEVVTLAVR